MSDLTIRRWQTLVGKIFYKNFDSKKVPMGGLASILQAGGRPFDLNEFLILPDLENMTNPKDGIMGALCFLVFS
jgi:hypothetical protein